LLLLLSPPAMPSVSLGRRMRSADSPAGPPAKRARHAHDAHANPHTNGLSNILLNGHGSGPKLTAAFQKSLKNPKAARIDDSHAVISNGDTSMPDASRPEIVEISSESSSSDSDDDSGDDGTALLQANGVSHENEDGSASGEDEDEDEPDEDIVPNGRRAPSIELGEDFRSEEPSFGEQLRADVAEPIDVEATLAIAAPGLSDMADSGARRALSALSASSLGTVLTQALRTNDRDLLESCFEMNDLESVRSTIERLPSNLVSNLLQRLAERIHKRPGRAGNLMVWVQWAIVSHGAHLAGQPDVVMRLGSLINVIRERANGLQPLLQLKGKLDMLSAQLELRRSMQGARDRNEDDEAVIYVEGEEDESGDEEGLVIADEFPSPAKSSLHAVRAQRKRERDAEVGADVSDDEDEQLPRIDGMEKYFDDEAEESDDEEGLFDQDEDSEEEEDDEESSESNMEDDEEASGSEGEGEILESDQEEPDQLVKLSLSKLSRSR
jgi:U3 small nucleolar RNA-associated protein 5